ncbi:hypothetical protein F5880DRAFT_1510992 [Lentinula raphanica]|nr:hypothetical protein F5880DRAFT_1510992 [Lentinula raphanica]
MYGILKVLAVANMSSTLFETYTQHGSLLLLTAFVTVYSAQTVLLIVIDSELKVFVTVYIELRYFLTIPHNELNVLVTIASELNVLLIVIDNNKINVLVTVYSVLNMLVIVKHSELNIVHNICAHCCTHELNVLVIAVYIELLIIIHMYSTYMLIVKHSELKVFVTVYIELKCLNTVVYNQLNAYWLLKLKVFVTVYIELRYFLTVAYNELNGLFIAVNNKVNLYRFFEFLYATSLKRSICMAIVLHNVPHIGVSVFVTVYIKLHQLITVVHNEFSLSVVYFNKTVTYIE